jgi:membrane protease YdiL (CAAX protease family)
MHLPSPPHAPPPSQRRRSSALALLLIVPALSIGVWAAMFAWPGTLIGKAMYAGCKLWIALLPVVWHLAVDRQRPSLSPVRRGGLGVAVMLGLLISLIIFIGYVVLGRMWIEPEHVRDAAARSGIGTPLIFLGLAVYLIAVNSLIEEFVYRWFVFRKCEVFMPPALAVITSAAFFTVHHVILLKAQVGWPATLLASLGVFAGGAIWSVLYLRYRSIWPCYLCHAIVDVAVFAIGWDLIFGG